MVTVNLEAIDEGMAELLRYCPEWLRDDVAGPETFPANSAVARIRKSIRVIAQEFELQRSV